MSDTVMRTEPAPPAEGAPASHHDIEAMMRYDANKKLVTVAYVLWFFFGAIGGHRFYLRRTGTAVTMLIIFLVSAVVSFLGFGAFGFAIVAVWALVDAFLIPGMTRDYNNRLISSLNM